MFSIKNIIIIPICGFANRLRFISSSIILFKEFGIIPKIHWTPSTDCNISHSDIFKSFNNIEFIDIIPEKYLFYGHIHLSEVINRLKAQTNLINYETLIVAGGHEYKVDSLTNTKYISLKTQLYQNIQWNEAILSKISEIKNNIGIINNEYITIHYRDIDNRFDTQDLKKSDNIDFNNNSPLSEFIKYSSSIKKYKILLFSNSDIVEIPNTIRISNKICDRNKTDSMIQSIIEFILMSNSKLIIGTYYSSFSDEACFFNCIPKIIPINSNIDYRNYHCVGINKVDKVLCLNYSTKTFIECLDL